MMMDRITRSSACAPALLAIALLATVAGAYPPPEARIAVVRKDVPIYAGPHDTYYTFGRLHEGDLIKVVGQTNGWARVQAVGPAFEALHGIVRYRRSDTGRLRIAADGRSAVALGPIDVLAPNLNTNNPTDSWKAVAHLQTGQRLVIRETATTDLEIVHTIDLPPQAIGWVNEAHLRTASPEETRQWHRTATDVPETVLGRPEQAPPAVDLTGAATRSEPKAIPEATAAATESSPTGGTATSTPTQVPAATPPAIRAEGAAGRGPDRQHARADVAVGEWFHTDRDRSRRRRRRRDPRDDAPTQANAPAEPVASTARPTLDDLEGAYAHLREEPIERAEVTPLRNLYIELAERNAGNRTIARYARARAEQLLIWAQLQERRTELEALRDRANTVTAESTAVRRALEKAGDYTAVGRLAASTIYNGRRLPLLLRLQDPGTGRTVAYIKPTGEFRLMTLVGRLVGIIGEKDYDGGLRLNVVDPVHQVDVLTPGGDEQM